uniref:SPARC/Testican calcium-binding domain-containing protein n=1 Tax=Strigamia maritima TaxID=126957 RepID=T1JLX6_STRMM
KTDVKSASNHNPPLAEDKQRQKGHNSVLSEKMDKAKATVADKSDCTPHQLKVMQNRLLDWFAQLITEAMKQKKMHLQGAVQTIDQHCQPQVEWVFNHLDNDPRDGQLSLHELDDLERDAHEHCMKPFLEHCDSNRDADLTPAEWCACFDSKERPCLTAKTRSKTSFM